MFQSERALPSEVNVLFFPSLLPRGFTFSPFISITFSGNADRIESEMDLAGNTHIFGQLKLWCRETLHNGLLHLPDAFFKDWFSNWSATPLEGTFPPPLCLMKAEKGNVGGHLTHSLEHSL